MIYLWSSIIHHLQTLSLQSGARCKSSSFPFDSSSEVLPFSHSTHHLFSICVSLRQLFHIIRVTSHPRQLRTHKPLRQYHLHHCLIHQRHNFPQYSPLFTYSSVLHQPSNYEDRPSTLSTMSPPTLLTLPFEIRMQIFRLLMPPLTPYCRGRDICRQAFQHEHFLPPGICRQINHEMGKLYCTWHHTHVTVNDGDILCTMPPRFSNEGYQKLGNAGYADVLLRESRKIYVDQMDYAWRSDDEEIRLFMKRFLASLKRVESLRIQFTSPYWPVRAEESTARFVKRLEEGLEGMPRVKEYLVLDERSSVLCWR